MIKLTSLFSNQPADNIKRKCKRDEKISLEFIATPKTEA